MSKGHATWRGLAQIGGGLALGIGAAALAAGKFGRGYIHDQLAAENITMPAGPALESLPESDQKALRPYAGQPMTTGTQAKAFAENYIAVHLKESCTNLTSKDGSKKFAPIPEGMRNHNGIGGILRAGTLTDPDEIEAYAALREDVFMGDMLRSTLLNVYGWSILASIGYYAGIALVAVGPLLAAVGLALPKSKDDN